MKNLKILSLLALITMSSLSPTQASAYFTREEVSHCVDRDINTGVGVVVGGLASAALGMVLSKGNPLIGVGAGVGGAALGGLLGSELSCTQRTVYVDRLESHLSSINYRDPMREDDLELTVIRAGYTPAREYCRTYNMNYTDVRGSWHEETSTSCWIGGRWQHGYGPDVISDIRWRSQQPYYRPAYMPDPREQWERNRIRREIREENRRDLMETRRRIREEQMDLRYRENQRRYDYYNSVQ